MLRLFKLLTMSGNLHHIVVYVLAEDTTQQMLDWYYSKSRTV